MSCNTWKNVGSSGDQSKEKRSGKNKRKKKEKKKQKESKEKQKKERRMEVRRVVEEWKIWEEEEEVAKLEVKARKLVLEKFHKWIQVFREKASEWMPTRKFWDHAIDTKKGFVPRKKKVYLLSRKEREEVHEFISEQLRKKYIRLSKLPQIAPVFFIDKKDSKK